MIRKAYFQLKWKIHGYGLTQDYSMLFLTASFQLLSRPHHRQAVLVVEREDQESE